MIDSKQPYFERMILMAIVKAIRQQEDTYSIENAMNILYSKLDEAIDDLENGRVISEEEMWAELDAI